MLMLVYRAGIWVNSRPEEFGQDTSPQSCTQGMEDPDSHLSATADRPVNIEESGPETFPRLRVKYSVNKLHVSVDKSTS